MAHPLHRPTRLGRRVLINAGWYERFSAFLECQNKNCGEIVVISGNLEHLHDFYHDECGVINEEFVSYFVPKSLIPAQPLFPLHVAYPDEIKRELSRAFGLIWPDQTACANRLRVCVELFLDERDVPKAQNLHRRIESIKLDQPITYEMLLAIKWIGNAGSHSDILGFSRTDLLDAFDIFAFVLEEAYLERKGMLQEIAAKINAANIKHP